MSVVLLRRTLHICATVVIIDIVGFIVSSLHKVRGAILRVTIQSIVACAP